MKKIKVAGIRQVLHLSLIEILSLPRGPDSMARLLAPLADQGINLEFAVVQSNPDKSSGLLLGVRRDHMAAALGLLQARHDEFGVDIVRSHDPVAMISLFPHGNRAAVIGIFLSAFHDAGVKLLAIAFSLSALSGFMEENQVADALNALGDYFELPG